MENRMIIRKLFSKLEESRMVHKYANITYFELGLRYILKRYDCFSVTSRTGIFFENINLSNLSHISYLLDHGWRILSQERNFITVRAESGVTITSRTNKGFDLGHIVEIYIKKEYGENFEKNNIIDVGMSNGDSSIYFAICGAKKVVGIEPTQESFELAVRNIRENGLQDKIIAINKAVTPHSGQTELFAYPDSPNANSIDSENIVHLGSKKVKFTVQGIRLEDIIDMFDGEPVNLLKMDCEGCEYSILQSLKTDSYKKIQKLVLEYHNGLQELPNLLKKMGYEVLVSKSNSSMGFIKAEKVRHN